MIKMSQYKIYLMVVHNKKILTVGCEVNIKEGAQHYLIPVDGGTNIEEEATSVVPIY